MCRHQLVFGRLFTPSLSFNFNFNFNNHNLKNRGIEWELSGSAAECRVPLGVALVYKVSGKHPVTLSPPSPITCVSIVSATWDCAMRHKPRSLGDRG
jgi:hypothetical protein